jgi:hypothetical protein
MKAALAGEGFGSLVTTDFRGLQPASAEEWLRYASGGLITGKTTVEAVN